MGGLWHEEQRGAPGFAGQLFAGADVIGGILRLRWWRERWVLACARAREAGSCVIAVSAQQSSSRSLLYNSKCIILFSLGVTDSYQPCWAVAGWMGDRHLAFLCLPQAAHIPGWGFVTNVPQILSWQCTAPDGDSPLAPRCPSLPILPAVLIYLISLLQLLSQNVP